MSSVVPIATRKVKQTGSKSKTPQAKESDLKIKMLTKLASSGLDSEDAQDMEIELVSAAQVAALDLPFPKEGFLIPYFTPTGKRTKFFRVRYMEDTRSGFEKAANKKPVRYVQPSHSDPDIYLPPIQVNWKAILDNTEAPLVITEGELKAACATKHGYPTIGLGGVWSFMSKRHNQPLIKPLQDIAWKGRTVYICYDSDAVTNPNVVMAESRLATQLSSRGAFVFITRLPSEDDGTKLGLDDYIVRYGPEAFVALLEGDSTYELEQSRVLHELNEKVVYVLKQMVVYDYQYSRQMSPAEFCTSAFANWHYYETVTNSKGDTKQVKTSAPRAWLEWGARAECVGMAFEPGQPRITSNNHLNMWSGWGMDEPVAGDVTPWITLLDHIFGIDKEARAWFEKWCAYPLQHPGTKMATAALVWGPVHGSGKTLIGHTLMRLYGEHSAELKDTDLDNDRNEWAEGICFALCDDITARGDRKFMRRLMTMITQKHIRLNPKYVRSYSLPDRINYYFTSNDPDAMYMDSQDRRFFIHETRAGKFKDFREYVAWRDSDVGIKALWYYLLNLDTTGFDPMDTAPYSTGKQAMVEMGKGHLSAWVWELKMNTEYVLRESGLTCDLVTSKQLYAIYNPDDAHGKGSANALSRELKREGFLPCCEGKAVKITPEHGTEYQTVIWPMRNVDKWLDASWSQVRDEFTKHNHTPKRGKKF